ncbi:hypothetical protein EC9_22910 [Rosistilla ulvae]|uniref:Uncharacterized protein n=1 Tax=Rosistilla ulvae TaxID=1930277 RepID=A0A517LZR1_9BACT|nr:hypothetical protein EC9_22910 [Rosistilla ulvae]
MPVLKMVPLSQVEQDCFAHRGAYNDGCCRHRCGVYRVRIPPWADDIAVRKLDIGVAADVLLPTPCKKIRGGRGIELVSLLVGLVPKIFALTRFTACAGRSPVYRFSKHPTCLVFSIYWRLGATVHPIIADRGASCSRGIALSEVARYLAIALHRVFSGFIVSKFG